MAKELKHIDISNIPELVHLIEQMRASNEPRVLQREHEDVAILQPIKKARKSRVPRGKPFTKDDSLFNLIGIAKGRDDGIHDVSDNVDKYVAEAYADTHE
jgi:hypothetical protein